MFGEYLLSTTGGLLDEDDIAQTKYKPEEKTYSLLISTDDGNKLYY